jgi:hypothetical protein
VSQRLTALQAAEPRKMSKLKTQTNRLRYLGLRPPPKLRQKTLVPGCRMFDGQDVDA